MKAHKLFCLYGIVLIFLLAIWEYAGQHSMTFRLLLSSPSLVWNYMLANWTLVQQSILLTFWASVGGFLLSIGVAVLLAVICVFVRPFRQIIMPPLVLLQGMPLVSLAPFFIIVLGAGLASKLAMAMVITFFPIFLNLMTGLNAIPKNVHEFLDTYNAPRFFRLHRIYFPFALPSFMAGMKIASNLAVIGVLVAEVIVSEAGLGRMVYLSAIRLKPELFVVSLILSSLMGMVFYMAVWCVERWVGSWYVKEQVLFRESRHD